VNSRVAFIGLGTMGLPMAIRLLRAGFSVTVHNRTRAREEEAAAAGARRAATPKEAAAGAEVVFTMVSDFPDVLEVVLGDEGAVYGMNAGGVLIDMSTISPAVTRDVAQALEARGIDMLDAPVSGGSEGAKSGTLSIMVGGKREVLERVRPLLDHLGKTITLVGPVGSGQLTKAINQVIVAGTYAAVAEGMTLGLAAGIDIEAAHEALSSGAAGSWVLANRAQHD
jgi:3-hydroxyisobutyrate dehydrogenase